MEKVELSRWIVGMAQDNLCILVEDKYLMMITPTNVYELLEALDDDSVLEFVLPTQLMIPQEFVTRTKPDYYGEDVEVESYQMNYNFPPYSSYDDENFEKFKVGEVEDYLLVFDSLVDKNMFAYTLWEEGFGLEAVSFMADQARVSQ